MVTNLAALGTRMTDVQALISDLANSELLPIATLKVCVAHRDQTVPVFLAVLEKASSKEILEDDEERALFLIIHLLAEMGVTEAFAPLMRFLRQDESNVKTILDDAVTETLHKVMISTFDGGIEALYQVMEDPAAYEFARNAAFRVWSYLVSTDVVSRCAAEQYLTKCFGTLQPQTENYVWTSWFDSVAVLGFENLRPLAQKACDAGYVDPLSMDMDDFDWVLEEALAKDDHEAFLRRHRLEPFTDTIGTFSRWYGYSEEYVREKRQYQSQVRMADLDTITNLYRDVGRNDPCPCGSGKKFKKCCLN